MLPNKLALLAHGGAVGGPQQAYSSASINNPQFFTIMFDISLGEILVVGGAGIILLGKKDMPLVFRLVGRTVGKVSGLVQGGRARMAQMSKGNDFLQLQNEIRSNLDDLRVIKSEIVGAARLPSTVTSTAHPGSQTLRSQVTPTPSPPPSTPEYGLSVTATTQHSTANASQANGDVSPSLRQAQTASPSRVRETEVAAAPGSGVADSAMFNERAMSGNAVGRGQEQGLGDVGGGLGARPVSAVTSVRSAGSDKLQQLAILEMKLREDGAHVTTTDSTATGADIVLDAITESLLQERFKRALAEAARGQQPSAAAGLAPRSPTSNDPPQGDDNGGKPSPGEDKDSA